MTSRYHKDLHALIYSSQVWKQRNTMGAKTYRHTAETQYGTFRADFVEHQYPLAVVYCGWKDLPGATKRRLEEKEGIVYGWARDMDHSAKLADDAVMEGCLNVIIADVKVRELP